jgi:ArsR family transcriptional regulator, arsenate/arsenite/antimonite-responsive transcriptional repressor
MEARASLAVEMDWALSSAHRLGRRSLRPALEDLYRSDCGLVERITGLWGGDEALSYPGYPELSVLAHHGGLMWTTDGDRFVEELEAAAAHGPADWPFPSETPDDEARINRRLKTLRSSAKRRRTYVGVVGDVWAALRADWETAGRPAVEREITQRRLLLHRHQPWQEFAANDTCTVDLPALVAALARDDELVVVPAYYSQTGLVIDMPGLLVVGVGTDDPAATARAQADRLAPRLKAVADPTRLALLAGLARREMTVTEMAQELSVSQPTVSNHVKLLREAGLVTMRNDGRNRYLTLDRGAFEDLEHDLQHLLRIDG